MTPPKDRLALPKVMSIGWDWTSPRLEQLQRALAPFKVHVYEDPTTEGSDALGFILSDTPLTPEELAVHAEVLGHL